VTYTISATAIRVFYGFKNPSLSDERFYQTVGHTFMPGTPYMLRELGLASYTSGVLMGVADAAVPQEFALIGYATPDVYRSATNNTLQGRMYSQTHGGVYDSSRSHAAFPVDLAHLPPGATDPFFTWGDITDWQAGRIAVYIGRANDGISGNEFRKAVRDAVCAIGKGDNDLLICLPEDHFFIAWVHACDSRSPAPDWSPLTRVSKTVLVTTARRVVWRDSEPPALDFTESSVLNWVFVREDRYFLS
jgi:hypothetical protein